jgi:Ca2+-binding EF-hand superfamily protein
MDETYELKKIFNGMDTDGDGRLSRQELYNGYQQLNIDFEDIDSMIA